MGNDGKATMKVACMHCGSEHTLVVNAADFKLWQAGGRVQVVMPYLSADERELLISGTCARCWQELVSDELFI